MVIRGGENIYPREIEEFLYTHPDIEDVQVIGVPDERYGEELAAWIKLRAGADPLDESKVREFASGKLAHYKIPRYVLLVDEFPMTVTGKIRKVQMREETTEKLGLSVVEGGAGMSTIDTLAEEYWAHYLEVEPTHAHLLGDYSGAGRFEEATRESEDREIAAMRDFAQRAAAIDESDLTDQQRITRDVVISERDHPRRHHGDPSLGDGRRPDLRPAGLGADPDGHARAPRRRRGRGARRQAARARSLLRRARGAPARRRGRRTAPGRVRRRPTRSASSMACSRGRSRTTRCCHDHTAATGSRRRCLEGPAARGGRDRRTSAAAGLSRRAARRGPPARAAGRQVRPELGARRRHGVRRHAAPLHDHDEVGAGDPRHRPRAGREARGRVPQPRPRGRRHRRPARRSSRRCAANPGCTSAPATSW